MKSKKNIKNIFNRLFLHFGQQYWWPADSSFEVVLGAILTQNTNWANVEKAVNNLKREKLITPKKIYRLPQDKLARLIRPAGYFNIKAKRIKNFINFLFSDYSGSVKKMFARDIAVLRESLLSVNGIGEETADSIILYAAGQPIFVVDTYTKRIFARLGFFRDESSYHDVQNFFMQNLPPDVKMFNEFHALIVRLAKEFCLKNKPKCKLCPLN